MAKSQPVPRNHPTAKPPADRPAYNVDSIKIHRGLSGVRAKPGMYLGEQGNNMVFQMFKEIVDNSVDEFMAQRNNLVEVVFNASTNEIMVYDWAHGIPTGMHPTEGINTLTAVFTLLHAGGKFDSSAYASSAGTFGIGSAAVNAVSELFEAWTYWNKRWHYQSFAQGEPSSEVVMRDPPASISGRLSYFKNKGTLIRFVPDQAVVSSAEQGSAATLELKQAAEYLRTLAYLNGGLTLVLTSETHSKSATFFKAGGLETLVNERIDRSGLDRVVATTFNHASVKVTGQPALAFSLAWTNYDAEDGLWSYVNSSRTIDGGSHIDGFFTAYQRALLAAAKVMAPTQDEAKQPIVRVKGRVKGKKSRTEVSLDKLSLRDLKMGMVGVINVHMSGAAYSSQTKNRLTSAISKNIEALVFPALEAYFKANPNVVKTLVNKAGEVAKSRDHFKNVLKSISTIKKSGGLLPNILTTALKATPDTRELYIVEGQSAAGPATSARDSAYQEVLALSGKIMNVERASLDKLLGSEPVRNLLIAMGANVDAIAPGSEHLSTTSLRVKHVIGLADADPDGSHITVLILTLLWRFFPDLYKEGRVMVVDAPLYLATYKGQHHFADTFAECHAKLPQGAPKTAVMRIKGLGEQSAASLRYIAFDPATRATVLIAPPPTPDTLGYFQRIVGSDSTERKRLLGLI
jgi:DNA gyrase subunit B